jgi:hypothetical protein
MSSTAKRSILRWIHIVLGIPIIGYIYSPFDQIPNYAPATRFVFVPILVLSGLWMWKGHVLRRLISRRPANQMLPGSIGQAWRSNESIGTN